MRGGAAGSVVSKASKSCAPSKRNILCRLHFRTNNVMTVKRKRDAAATDAIMIAKFVLLLENGVPGDEVATGVSKCGKLQILDEKYRIDQAKKSKFALSRW